MSVLIKGMEMPTEDEEIMIRIDSSGTVMTEYALPISGTKAVPIPAHGRLIDADELFKEMERKGWFDNADRDKAEDLVLDAPTIIPASKED